MAPVGRCCSKGQCISMGGPGTWDLPVVETTLTLWDHCPYSPAGWMSTQERVAFRGNGVNKEIGTPAQVRAETPVLVPFWLLHSCAVEWLWDSWVFYFFPEIKHSYLRAVCEVGLPASLLEYTGKLAHLGGYKSGRGSADLTRKKEVGEGALPAPPDRAWVTCSLSRNPQRPIDGQPHASKGLLENSLPTSFPQRLADVGT